MNGKPIEVPTVDQLIAEPCRVFQLPPDVARTVLGGVSAIIPNLVAQAARDLNKTEAPSTPERWLTAEEASTLFGVKPRWLRENKDRLPHSKPSRKVLLFEETKLRKWFVAHKAN